MHLIHARIRARRPNSCTEFMHLIHAPNSCTEFISVQLRMASVRTGQWELEGCTKAKQASTCADPPASTLASNKPCLRPARRPNSCTELMHLIHAPNWCTSIQFNSFQLNSLQFTSVYFNLLQFISIYFSLFQFISIRFSVIQFNSIQFNSIQLNAVQFNSIQFNAIQFPSPRYVASRMLWFGRLWQIC